jgi:hypothetical protein
MKALARTLLIALAGAGTLTAALPVQADHGRGWEFRDGRGWESRDDRDHGRHWRAHKPQRPIYGPVIHRAPVVIYRPPVVIHEAPVVYERRVYYGPTYHTPCHTEPSVSFGFTVPLR